MLAGSFSMFLFTPILLTLHVGDCDFERGFCNWENWINEEQDQFDWKIGTAVIKTCPGINLQHPSNPFVTGKIIRTACL